jgi:ABC-2 type transport system permease protein
VVQRAAIALIQSIIIVALALVIGARFDGGAAGISVMLVVAMLLAAAVSALSNGFSPLVRQCESLIGMVTLVSLPLAFLSTVFMQRDLLPSWMQDVSRLNPVNWAAVVARSSTTSSIDWSLVGVRVALLVVLAAVCMTLATLAFRFYSRTL